MDVIKTESKTDPLDLEPSDCTYVEDKDPLSQEGSFSNFDVSGIKMELTDSNYEDTFRIKHEGASATFPILKSEIMDESYDGITVKAELDREGTTKANEEDTKSFPVLHNYGKSSGSARHQNDVTWENSQSIELPVDDTSAIGVATCNRSSENDILDESSPNTMNCTSEYNLSGMSEKFLEIIPKSVGFKSFECDLCGKYLANFNSQKLHMLKHRNEESVKYMCATSYEGKGDFRKEVRDFSSERPMQCTVCGKFLSTYSNLKMHLQRHTGNKSFKCDACYKEFVCLADLNQHRLTHTGHKTLKCDLCEKTFRRLAHLKRHIVIHKGIKPFKCSVCGKCFGQSGNLNRHLTTHSCNRPFKCEVCGKNFHLLSNLKIHMSVHSGDKPFKCDVCGKTFGQACNLSVHSRIHSGDKPFKCTHCDKTFRHSQGLHRHSRIHTGNTPFKCNVCGKFYVDSSGFKRHIRSHTNYKLFN